MLYICFGQIIWLLYVLHWLAPTDIVLRNVNIRYVLSFSGKITRWSPLSTLKSYHHYNWKSAYVQRPNNFASPIANTNRYVHARGEEGVFGSQTQATGWIFEKDLVLLMLNLWILSPFCAALSRICGQLNNPSWHFMDRSGFVDILCPQIYFRINPLFRGRSFINPRTAGGAHMCPPIGFSQIAEKWRRAAPPNLA